MANMAIWDSTADIIQRIADRQKWTYVVTLDQAARCMAATLGIDIHDIDKNNKSVEEPT